MNNMDHSLGCDLKPSGPAPYPRHKILFGPHVGLYRIFEWSLTKLSGHDSRAVWALAGPGQQYLDCTVSGKKFVLNPASGQYTNNIRVNAKTGATQAAALVSGGKARGVSPPVPRRIGY